MSTRPGSTLAPSAERSSDPLAVPDELGGGDSALGAHHPRWPAGGAHWGELASGVEGAEAAGGATVGGVAGATHGGEAAEGTHQAEDSGEAEAAWRPTRLTPTASTDSNATRSRTVSRCKG